MQNKIAEEKSEQTPLTVLKGYLQDDFDKVDGLIYELIKSKVSLIPEISDHTISSGGKRMRPMLTLATANMCGYKGDAHIDLAACVEFIHTATLLHDDVVDKSDLRRGNSTANNVWGNKESILVGDFLLGKAFSLMGAGKSLEIYRILSDAAVIISEGEVMQLAATGKLIENSDNYTKIIASKTAELFAAACEVGGVLAGIEQGKAKSLRNYGMALGIAFQIIDDALDYSAKQEKLGKSVGDDFKERKVTLPVILSYTNANAEEKAFWSRTIEGGRQEARDVAIAVSYVEKSGAIEESIKVAKSYTDEARKSILFMDEGPIRDSLVGLLDFVLDREF